MTNKLSFKSTAFNNNEMIPSKYTCDGESLIPPLQISGIPDNAKSLALIMDDPDATIGTFTHWTMWNISPIITEIKEDVAPTAIYGKNSSGKTKYVGPCPVTGLHRYYFKLYVLDTTVSLVEGSTKQELEKIMSGHILDQTELIGLYKRRK